ncbi:MAG: SGNH/GDSL hydrolase family protein [Clostridia bacterium]|nr:SGNH/GDSL hydrolase family protein [Clostridia bacterium]
MKLNIEQLRAVTCGAVRVEETDFGLGFFRFTRAQEEMYKARKEEFYIRCFATSGITLNFKTDSKKLFLKGRTTRGSSRKYYSVDVVVNGEPIDHIDNFSHTDVPERYAGMTLELGSFEKNINLGEGEKEVCVYLPWGHNAEFSEVTLDDGATLVPVKYSKKLLAFGDSITHGYDALRNYDKYVTRLAEALGCEEYNKGIGGERFVPSLSALKEDFVPDIITVAYGTNDWNNVDEQTFTENCSEFFKNLCTNYPSVPIFAITPIWRADLENERPMGAFENADRLISEITAKYDNVRVIHGLEIFPAEYTLFADYKLHPSSKGFEHYFKNLYAKIKEII